MALRPDSSSRFGTVVDWYKPLRLVSTGRRVYARSDGFDSNDVALDPLAGRTEWHSYTDYGKPRQNDCPWGAIENYDPEADFFDTPENAQPHAKEIREQKRFAESLDALQDNPLWGAF